MASAISTDPDTDTETIGQTVRSIARAILSDDATAGDLLSALAAGAVSGGAGLQDIEQIDDEIAAGESGSIIITLCLTVYSESADGAESIRCKL